MFSSPYFGPGLYKEKGVDNILRNSYWFTWRSGFPPDITSCRFSLIVSIEHSSLKYKFRPFVIGSVCINHIVNAINYQVKNEIDCENMKDKICAIFTKIVVDISVKYRNDEK